MASPPELSRLLDAVAEPILVLRRRSPARPAPEILWLNEAFQTVTGHRAEQLVGRSFRILRAGAARERFMHLLAAVQSGELFRGRIGVARADGSYVMLAVTGFGLPDEPTLYALIAEPEPPGGPGRVPDTLERAGFAAALTGGCFYVLRVAPDSRLELEWIDASIERLTGVSPAELQVSGNLLELIEPADLPDLRRRNQAVLAGRQATVEYRMRTARGDQRWVRDTARPESAEPDGVVTRVVGAISDIEHERGLGGHRQLRERYAAVLSYALHALVIELDAIGTLRWASAEPASAFADWLRQGVGRTLDELLGPREADRWLDWVEQSLTLQERAQFRFEWAAEGQSFDIVVAPVTAEAALAIVRPAGTMVINSLRSWGELPHGLEPADLLRRFTDLVLLLSPDGRVSHVLLEPETAGENRPPLRGEMFTALFAGPETQRQVADAVAAAGRTRSRVDLRAGLRPDLLGDLMLHWSLFGLGDENGATTGILARAEAVPVSLPPAPHSEPWLGAVIDSVADGIISITKDGLIESFSRSAEQIFDYNRDEVLGRDISVLLTAGPSADLNVLSLITEQLIVAPAPRELFGRRRSGEMIPVEVIVTRLEQDGPARFVVTLRDITIRRQTEETLRSLAYLDPLTGLPNRLLFHDRVGQAVERARRSRQMLTVMLIDLDRFKLINDSLGLEAGDQVLRTTGERMVAALRRSDTVARLGGDEFMVLLSTTANAEAAARVAQKLQDAMRPALDVGGHELSVTASLGIALFPYDGDDADTLIKNADTALSRSKEQGRNSYQFYTNDMNAMAFERLMLESRLRKALEQGELVIYYQPQVSLVTGRIVGAEALIRWFHPDLGMVPPGEFIPLAEETGLIVPIGDWVLRTACAEARRWQELGFRDLRVAVNISARQFQQNELVDTVSGALRDTGLAAAQLELELTESVIMRNAAETGRRLRALAALGVQLAVDDFGTGYSSLAYLRDFPIRSLKIDRSFVRDMDRDPRSTTITHAVMALASSLQLKAVAEGVETPEQLALLRRSGCEEMQGYLFARPLPADDFLALLREDRRLPG